MKKNGELKNEENVLSSDEQIAELVLGKKVVLVRKKSVEGERRVCGLEMAAQ